MPGPAPRSAGPAVGAQRLPADLRRVHAARRPRRRPARPPPHPRRRHLGHRRAVAGRWVRRERGVLVGTRLVQGLGAAMMLPAALSILTTTFKEGKDRHTAVGAWGAIGGLSAAAGVLLGGLLTAGPGWRWVMFVNPLACVLVLGGIFRLISGERRRARLHNFDLRGAVLATGGMLLLVYALVTAPTVGWGNAGTIGELAGALALLAAFVVNELRHRNPLAPLSIFRINGLGFSDLTQLTTFAG